jgi:DNA-binding NtrC family response regulator
VNSTREILPAIDPPIEEVSAPLQKVIAVVDDEPMVGEIVCAVLQMEGYKTHLFTCPSQALDYILGGSIKPDLIVTDYAMGPVNGMDLIERCRGVLPEVPSILCSGALEDVVRESATQPTAFLAKPFLPREMIRVVSEALPKSN